jgi:SAM-dependent methyltransferase
MKSIFKQLHEILNEEYPNYSQLWQNSLSDFGSAWEKELSLHIKTVFGERKNEKWLEAIHGYAEFCTEALRAQIFFEKTGRYQASSYAEVLESCYKNPEYMNQRYLPGQYLSHYIWPHHQKMLQRYLLNLLPIIRNDVRTFYEVGVGCGMYSQKTLEYLTKSEGVGYDISEYALSFTKNAIELHGYGNRYQTKLKDIIEKPISQKADFVISQEVLEHLENPDTFIIGLYEAVRPGGWGYITAAINAGHTDHIYLYRKPEEVEAQITAAGWEVVDVQIESNYEEKPIEFRPTIAGYLTRKP